MSPIYLDNAATTPIDNKVLEVMYTSMQENFGNPSSTHQFGRKAKSAVETARKNIAKHFNVSASEIIFTAGGTEADNLILHNAILNLNVKRIITSKIEHHAVLHTCNYLKKTYNISVDYVAVDKFGSINLSHLEELLSNTNDKTLVSLMHINNEIGTILPIDEVAVLCKKQNALFHSDTVQTIGHYTIDLQKISLDFIAVSAHKFHGPKGVGFSFVRKNSGLQPFIHGGSQERGLRAGTESVHNIVGMQKALELAYDNYEQEKTQVVELKAYFIKKIKELFPEAIFNGLSGIENKSTYTLINVALPIPTDKALMLDFHLDLKGIACSKGSACQSGSASGSHVLNEIQEPPVKDWPSLRFSFSIFNTKKEVDYLIEVFRDFIK